MVALLKLILPFAPSIIGWALQTFFGISPAQDERDKERQAGETLGKTETAEATNEKTIDQTRKAAQAARVAGDIDDAGGVRNGRAGDRVWNPDSLD